MKIKKYNKENIIFDNGSFIEFAHECDCYEDNYADFQGSLKDTNILDIEFDSIELNVVERYGFELYLIKDDCKYRFPIACYTKQNGYYSSDLEVYYSDVNNQEIASIHIKDIMFYYS